MQNGHDGPDATPQRVYFVFGVTESRDTFNFLKAT